MIFQCCCCYNETKKEYFCVDDILYCDKCLHNEVDDDEWEILNNYFPEKYHIVFNTNQY